MEEWRRKLTAFLRDKSKQELISREKKDRCDFEQLSALATGMGLYRYFLLYCSRSFDQCANFCINMGFWFCITCDSHLYAKVVVFSKVPLPNYRFDLDDRRPQREVSSWRIESLLFLSKYSFYSHPTMKSWIYLEKISSSIFPLLLTWKVHPLAALLSYLTVFCTSIYLLF